MVYDTVCFIIYLETRTEIESLFSCPQPEGNVNYYYSYSMKNEIQDTCTLNLDSDIIVLTKYNYILHILQRQVRWFECKLCAVTLKLLSCV